MKTYEDEEFERIKKESEWRKKQRVIEDDDDIQDYKKPWVDLTRKEFAEILCDDRWQGRPELMMLQVQAKLKGKNK